ncbi:hypothetical protein [Streptosporangium pseudovulgare]|uniref:DUF5667 domain-containing protein n=1 Tax=Streptosporangium pseudovulgare TaxID=35765 RepID=A0ABQ2QWY6_9ACTN|nr:hypothetical protein [Streptosporangium pseudovulgare]GGP97961.1 hypothetical protein GCM10010140_30110 [Streptosporangium pseudovulgare]
MNVDPDPWANAERALPADRHQVIKEFLMQEIQQDPRPAPARRLPFRRPVLLLAAAAVAAAAAVTVPMVTGGTPAYAVAENPDGSIEVQIKEFKDPKKLEADLKDLGLNVVVDYVPPGKRCEGTRGDFLPESEAGDLLTVDREKTGIAKRLDEITLRLDPAVLKPGQTAMLQFAEMRGNPSGVVMASLARITNGTVAPCVLVDSPTPGFDEYR